MQFHTIVAEYSDNQHAIAILDLMDHYAEGIMGGNKSLPKEVRENLVNELDKIAGAFTVLCMDNKKAVGLITAFQGFSTFKCKPLINLHDVVVLEEYRGQGICKLMLEAVERIARERGCCKLTLEVLSENRSAKSAYQKFGFSLYELDPTAGSAEFMEKVF